MSEYAFVETVVATITENALIPAESRVCVCLSGGADSVSLLRSLCEKQSTFKLHLSAIHINHMIRGDEADRDERFCRELCLKLGIAFNSVRVDVPTLMKTSGKSLEETARDARYKVFEEFGKEQGVDLFATAHTASDNAETVLFNIIRGTSLAGVAGIPIKRGNFIRPLIKLYREDVIEFLSLLKQDYVTDSTNLVNDCTRNIIRNKVFPLLSEINPAVKQNICRLADCAAEDNRFISESLDKFDGMPLYEMPYAVSSRIVRRLHLLECGAGLTEKHVKRIVCASRTNTKLSLPQNITAVLSDGHVSFVKNEVIITCKRPPELLEFGAEKEFGNGTKVYFGNRLPEKYDVFIKINAKKLIGDVFYRMRLTGDRLCCLGVNRSLKKEFINKKIPSERRDDIPVFFDEEGIVYVPFIGAADRVYTVADDAAVIAVKFAERLEII